MSKHGTALTLGQFAEFSSAVLSNLPRDIDPFIARGWVESRASLARALREALCLPETRLLVPRGPAKATLTKRLDAKASYRNQGDLHVSDDYRAFIVRHAAPIEAGTTFAFQISDLTREATDKEIENALTDGYWFKKTPVCGMIAALVALQPNGGPGKLLHEGSKNLFFTSSIVIVVEWSAVRRGWHVMTCPRGRYVWPTSSRVFSPAV